MGHGAIKTLCLINVNTYRARWRNLLSRNRGKRCQNYDKGKRVMWPDGHPVHAQSHPELDAHEPCVNPAHAL